MNHTQLIFMCLVITFWGHGYQSYGLLQRYSNVWNVDGGPSWPWALSNFLHVASVDVKVEPRENPLGIF